MARYLRATGREEVAALADGIAGSLRADAETAAEPEKYYDRVIEIDLSSLEPYINGPLRPMPRIRSPNSAPGCAKKGSRSGWKSA